LPRLLDITTSPASGSPQKRQRRWQTRSELANRVSAHIFGQGPGRAILASNENVRLAVLSPVHQRSLIRQDPVFCSSRSKFPSGWCGRNSYVDALLISGAPGDAATLLVHPIGLIFRRVLGLRNPQSESELLFHTADPLLFFAERPVTDGCREASCWEAAVLAGG
jgi:hypothetical protein